MNYLKLRDAPVPPAPSQTFLSGSREALHCLDPSLTAPFHPFENALCVEASLLPHLTQADTWRYVFVVRNVKELRHFVNAVDLGNCVLVVVVAADERQALALRMLVLHKLPNAGVLIIRNNDKGMRVIRDVIREEKWPDPIYTGTHDFILPPRWDSTGKIHAVAMASGMTLDSLLEEEHRPEPQTRKAPMDYERAKRNIIEEEQNWLRQMDTKMHPSPQKPADDFFQKLLQR